MVSELRTYLFQCDQCAFSATVKMLHEPQLRPNLKPPEGWTVESTRHGRAINFCVPCSAKRANIRGKWKLGLVPNLTLICAQYPETLVPFPWVSGPGAIACDNCGQGQSIDHSVCPYCKHRHGRPMGEW